MSTEFERQKRQLRVRVGRVKRFLKPLPRRANVGRYPVIKWFAEAARQRPYLWSFKKSHVIAAFYAGAIVAFLPLTGLQMLLAFWAALLARANLAVTIALQFLTNPLTMGPIYYTTYKIGMKLIEVTGFMQGPSHLGTRINALFIGGVVLGLIVAVVLDLAYRLALWEADVFKRRFLRNHKKAQSDAAEAAVDAPTVPDTLGQEPLPGQPPSPEPGPPPGQDPPPIQDPLPSQQPSPVQEPPSGQDPPPAIEDPAQRIKQVG